MRQPELGNQISVARKSKNITQLQLAELCNVDIRTIQRIESGEVNPRKSTLNLINANLDTSFYLTEALNNGKNKNIKNIFSTGWISGLLMYCLLPLMIFEAISFINDKISIEEWPFSIVVIYNIFYLITLALLFRSVYYFGKIKFNTLIKIGSTAIILLYSVIIAVKLFAISQNVEMSSYVYIALWSLVGIANVVLGIGFILIISPYKQLATLTGVMMIITGLSFLFIALAGFLMGIITLILLLIYLIKFEKSQY